MWQDALRENVIPLTVYWNYKISLGVPATPFVWAFTFAGIPYFIIFLLTENAFIALKIFVVLSYFLSATTMYFYARRLYAHRAFSLISAVVYAYASYRINEITLGHWTMMWGAVIFPIFLFSFEGWLRKPSVKTDLTVAVSLAMLLLSDAHYVLWASIFLIFRLIIFYLLSLKRNSKTIRDLFRYIPHLALSALLSLLILLPLYLPFLVLHPFARAYEQIKLYSATPESFLTRDWMTFSISVLKAFPARILYIGFVVLALSFLQIIIIRWDINYRKKTLYGTIFFIILLLFAMLFALGDYSPIPIYRVLFDYFPIVRSFRVPYRIMALIVLSLAVLSGYAVMFIYDAVKRAKGKSLAYLLLLIIIVAIIFDFNYGFTVSTIKIPSNRIHNSIAQEEGEFRILEIPSLWGLSEYYSTIVKPQAKVLAGYGYFTKLPFPDLEKQHYFLAGETFSPIFGRYLPKYGEYWQQYQNTSGEAHIYFDESIQALRMVINTSKKEDVVGIHQNIYKREYLIKEEEKGTIALTYPLLNEKMWLMTKFMILTKDTVFKIIIDMEKKESKVKLIYAFTDSAQTNIGNFTINVRRGAWESISRNLTSDLKTLGYSYNGLILKKLSAELSAMRGEAEINIKRISIEDRPSLGIRYAILGVKYILIYAGPPEGMSSWWNLNESEDFRLIDRQDNLLMFENKLFRGLGFVFKGELLDPHSIKLVNATVIRSRPDTNTIKVFVNTSEPGTLLISERWHEGWVVQSSKPIPLRLENTSNLMTINLPKAGTYEIVLHFSLYEYYLALVPIFWASALAIVVGALRWERRLKMPHRT